MNLKNLVGALDDIVKLNDINQNDHEGVIPISKKNFLYLREEEIPGLTEEDGNYKYRGWPLAIDGELK